MDVSWDDIVIEVQQRAAQLHCALRVCNNTNHGRDRDLDLQSMSIAKESLSVALNKYAQFAEWSCPEGLPLAPSCDMRNLESIVRALQAHAEELYDAVKFSKSRAHQDTVLLANVAGSHRSFLVVFDQYAFASDWRYAPATACACVCAAALSSIPQESVGPLPAGGAETTAEV